MCLLMSSLALYNYLDAVESLESLLSLIRDTITHLLSVSIFALATKSCLLFMMLSFNVAR